MMYNNLIENANHVLVNAGATLKACAEDVINQSNLWNEWRAWHRTHKNDPSYKQSLAQTLIADQLTYQQSVVQFVYWVMDTDRYLLQTKTVQDNSLTLLSPNINSEEFLRAVRWLEDNDMWKAFMDWSMVESGSMNSAQAILHYFHLYYLQENYKKPTPIQEQSEDEAGLTPEMAKLISVTRYLEANHLWDKFYGWYFKNRPTTLCPKAMAEYAEKNGWQGAQFYK